eukprot:SAG31_NODE_1433_length_8368_cov_8.437901_4_plen_172_part_00
MGNGASVVNTNLKQFVENEFGRVRRTHFGSLGLGEVMQLQSMRSIELDFCHIGVIYCLDKDHDGRVTTQELHSFMTSCAALSGQATHQGFRRLIETRCALQMWREAIKGANADRFVQWVCRLHEQAEPAIVRTTVDSAENGFQRERSVTFLSLEAVKLGYRLFKVGELQVQ